MRTLGFFKDVALLLGGLALLARAENNSQRLARCRARSRTKGPRGPIAHGLCVLCNLEDLLWRNLLGWEPDVRPAAMPADRPCGCGEK